MSSRTAEDQGLRYTIAVERPPPAARRWWAVVQGRMIDELTGAPPRAPARVSTNAAGLGPRVADGGLFGLVGIPADLFPELATRDYDIPVWLAADGYLPVRVETRVPMDGGFPAAFTPARLGDVALHREPVVVSGRVTRRVAGAEVAVAGATVEVRAIWPVLPPPDGSVPSEPPTLLSLDPPLQAGRTTATGHVRRHDLVPVASQDKALLERADAGGRRVRVSDHVGLNPGDTVRFDEFSSSAGSLFREYATVAEIESAGGGALPARLTFTHPLARWHRAGALVRRVEPPAGPPHPQRNLRRDAIAGDVCVFVDTLASLDGARDVEVSGGGSPPTYHRVRHFSAQTDPEGNYRLPPLGRVAQLELRATDPGGTTTETTSIPDYSRREYRLNLRF